MQECVSGGFRVGGLLGNGKLSAASSSMALVFGPHHAGRRERADSVSVKCTTHKADR